MGGLETYLRILFSFYFQSHLKISQKVNFPFNILYQVLKFPVGSVENVILMKFKFKLKLLNTQWVVLIDNNVPTDLY